MNCIVNLAAVGSGDIGISYCQEVSTAGFCSAISLREDTGWGLKQESQRRNMRKETLNMEKKDFKKGQKAILLSLKNVDFRKTMDIDAATEECTVVKVGRKYITVEDSHGWEIRFDMENNFEEVDDSFSYTRSELYLSREDAKKVLKRRYLIKAIEKSLHDMSWSTFDGISDQALQNLHTALIAVEKERIVLKK